MKEIVITREEFMKYGDKADKAIKAKLKRAGFDIGKKTEQNEDVYRGRIFYRQEVDDEERVR